MIFYDTVSIFSRHILKICIIFRPVLTIPENISVDRIIADGAHYSIEGVEQLSNCGITPVMPPPRNAKIYGQDNTIWHDGLVGYIAEKGSIYAFYTKYCYGIRARIEAQISRIKRCVASSLLTKKIESQKHEAIIIANIINLWNSLYPSEQSR